MTKQQIGALLASLAAASVISTGASADHHEKAAAKAGGAPDHQCQNNACKGHGACMGYGNAKCHGQNECKGKGWVAAKDEAECKTKNGIWNATAPAKEAPKADGKKAKKG